MKDIVQKDDVDLNKIILEKGDELRNFRFAISGSKTRNVREGRALRKVIAQVKTELSRRAKS